MDYRIDETLAAIEMASPETPTITALADAANLSVSRLQHLFKKDVGVSIKQYVKSVRLHKARALLEKTNLRVKEVGFAIGAYDNSHFVSDFKKAFGLYPTEYRIRFRSMSSKCQQTAENGIEYDKSPVNSRFRQH